MLRSRLFSIVVFLLNLAGGFPIHADEPEKHSFDDQLRLLADDAVSPAYRMLVDKMLTTDLDAEWQRVETTDNAESFAARHGRRLSKAPSKNNFRKPTL